MVSRAVKKMMRGFHQCKCRGVAKLGLAMVFVIFAFQIRASEAGREITNPLAELSSREELVKLAGYGEDKLSTVLVTGTVVCEARMDGAGILSQPVSGALVEVSCLTSEKKRKSASAEGISATDEYGDFVIDVPSHLHAIADLEKVCCVKVVSVPTSSFCHDASFVQKHKRIRLLTNENDIRTYAAGMIKFSQHTPKASQALSKLSSMINKGFNFGNM